MVNTEIPQPIGNTGLYIKYSSTDNQTKWIVNIPDKQSALYLQNFNAYQAALSNKIQTITNAQAAFDQANASLNALIAVARPENVSQAKAQVENARAGVQSIEAKLQNSLIVAPISGVITQFDAKVGQFATPGVALISIISDGSFEVDALVSETDVGKVVSGNKVVMTLDAFPNETFTGEVFYIDPAQTASEGVVGYKIKIAFDKADQRMKSGLTSNLNIETRHKDNILILPQYAILQNDQGTFVEVLQNKTVKDIPITLGIQDRNGNVEIISGVKNGEQVINIGLKH
jgi:HlyD family secretion protein